MKKKNTMIVRFCFQHRNIKKQKEKYDYLSTRCGNLSKIFSPKRRKMKPLLLQVRNNNNQLFHKLHLPLPLLPATTTSKRSVILSHCLTGTLLRRCPLSKHKRSPSRSQMKRCPSVRNCAIYSSTTSESATFNSYMLCIINFDER